DAAQARASARTAAAERTRVMAGGAAPAAPAAAPTRTVNSRAGQLGMLLTVVGAVVHSGSVVTRGLAAGRVPWGNMYEFSSCVALTGVVTFLVLVLTGRVERSLGAFVMVPVVLYLGLAGTVLYTAAGPLVPALDSYWIKIHVFAAILSSGAFLLSPARPVRRAGGV
ncbi:MAG: c-type cytochrome biogenesis protein CcsB, partial [Actinobacteria bacterium]|nr:c-type cytochrome biogenesis protein CcsB [Actinomycetota bacterium]